LGFFIQLQQKTQTRMHGQVSTLFESFALKSSVSSHNNSSAVDDSEMRFNGSTATESDYLLISSSLL
jgi:hypothetical protein